MNLRLKKVSSHSIRSTKGLIPENADKKDIIEPRHKNPRVTTPSPKLFLKIKSSSKPELKMYNSPHASNPHLSLTGKFIRDISTSRSEIIPSPQDKPKSSIIFTSAFLNRRRDMYGKRKSLKFAPVLNCQVSSKLVISPVKDCEFPWKKKICHPWQIPKSSVSTDRSHQSTLRANIGHSPLLMPEDNQQMFDAFLRQKVSTASALRQKIESRLRDSKAK